MSKDISTQYTKEQNKKNVAEEVMNFVNIKSKILFLQKIMECFCKRKELKQNKIPSRIENALKEYEELISYDCLIIPCKQCKYLRPSLEKADIYTCKIIDLMKILLPEYREEVHKIDNKIIEQRKFSNNVIL